MRGDRLNQRWIVDTTVLYTGIDKVTLAVNFDFAGEEHDQALVALGTWSLDSAVSMSATRPHRLSLFSVAFTNPRGRCGNGRPRKDEYSSKKLGASLNHSIRRRYGSSPPCWVRFGHQIRGSPTRGASIQRGLTGWVVDLIEFMKALTGEIDSEVGRPPALPN